MNDIKKLVDGNESNKLKALYQYNVRNAWFDIDFRGCLCGIFSAACPVEPLHALENGLISECIKVLYYKLGSLRILSFLEIIVKKVNHFTKTK